MNLCDLPHLNTEMYTLKESNVFKPLQFSLYISFIVLLVMGKAQRVRKFRHLYSEH